MKEMNQVTDGMITETNNNTDNMQKDLSTLLGDYINTRFANKPSDVATEECDELINSLHSIITNQVEESLEIIQTNELNVILDTWWKTIISMDQALYQYLVKIEKEDTQNFKEIVRAAYEFYVFCQTKYTSLSSPTLELAAIAEECAKTSKVCQSKIIEVIHIMEREEMAQEEEAKKEEEEQFKKDVIYRKLVNDAHQRNMDAKNK